MKMLTINEAARALKVSRLLLSRAVERGEIASMPLGARRVIDLDAARAYLGRRREAGVGVDALSTATGLTVGAIRRGVAEGWIPHWRDGRTLRFDVAAVCDAINRRMQGASET
ncbi:MAG: helix-turn-helix domain-containing protein [Candidatus Limiplasma sp.]|nr:helix-turn-helix domain-containing protein [Candidatus Limiplasma sp.]